MTAIRRGPPDICARSRSSTARSPSTITAPAWSGRRITLNFEISRNSDATLGGRFTADLPAIPARAAPRHGQHHPSTPRPAPCRSMRPFQGLDIAALGLIEPKLAELSNSQVVLSGRMSTQGPIGGSVPGPIEFQVNTANGTLNPAGPDQGTGAVEADAGHRADRLQPRPLSSREALARYRRADDRGERRYRRRHVGCGRRWRRAAAETVAEGGKVSGELDGPLLAGRRGGEHAGLAGAEHSRGHGRAGQSRSRHPVAERNHRSGKGRDGQG